MSDRFSLLWIDGPILHVPAFISPSHNQYYCAFVLNDILFLAITPCQLLSESAFRYLSPLTHLHPSILLLPHPPFSDTIRTFAMTDERHCPVAERILEVADDMGMHVWLGVWVDKYPETFEREFGELMRLVHMRKTNAAVGIGE